MSIRATQPVKSQIFSEHQQEAEPGTPQVIQPPMPQFLCLGQLAGAPIKDLILQPHFPQKNAEPIYEFHLEMLTGEGRREWQDVLAARVLSIAPKVNGVEVCLLGASAIRLRRFTSLLLGEAPDEECRRCLMGGPLP